MPAELRNILFSALGIVITAFAGWACTALIALINNKIKDKKVARFLSEITQIVFDAVQSVYQEFVEVLKEHEEFDETAQKEAKARAKAKIKASLCDELKQFLTTQYGDIEEWLDMKIESVLYLLKN